MNKIPATKENPQNLIERNETAIIIHQGISCLTEEQQEVIIMKFINELSNQEIANLLGKTKKALRQLQCRALKALRKYFHDSKII